MVAYCGEVLSSSLKRNATVIMNSSDYINKLKNLITPDKYVKLNKDPTTSIESKIYKLLKKHEDEFDNRTRSYLTPHHSKQVKPMIFWEKFRFSRLNSSLEKLRSK